MLDRYEMVRDGWYAGADGWYAGTGRMVRLDGSWRVVNLGMDALPPTPPSCLTVAGAPARPPQPRAWGAGARRACRRTGQSAWR
jgi:hypothetical protein